MRRLALLAVALACVRLCQGSRRGLQQANAWSCYSTVRSANTGEHWFESQLRLTREALPQYGPSFQRLSVKVTPETSSRLHVKIKPKDVPRWEVPQSIVQRPQADDVPSESSLLYELQQPSFSPNQPFALTIARKANGEAIFDTSGQSFIFKDQYIELTTNIPEDADLYGLGESTLPTGFLLPRSNKTITMWTRDIVAVSQGSNLYGAHPFYMQINNNGFAHGVLLLNSNGMDININKTSLTYKIIGGLVDLYFFMGPSPEAVVRQYHEVIGTPMMPPYWSLGAHQAKWGYQNISVVESVVSNYSMSGLALEAIWLDIEYMRNRFQSMAFDEVRFPISRMRRFVNGLHARGQKWIPILDPGIAAAEDCQAYEDGNTDDVWIKDYKGDTYLGQVWPGASVYPDYLSSPNVSSWLQRQLQTFYEQAHFDGLWLDMNEASNFCQGLNCEVDRANKIAMKWLEYDTPADYNLTEMFNPRTSCQLKCEQAAPSNKIAYPPYRIRNFAYDVGWGADLSAKSISTTAKHADGSLEYDAHNLYGTAMAKKHFEAFAAVTGKRPFILSRSTFPGAGQYTGHWTGDNAANWEDFYYAIGGMLNSNMWGIAMSGADICGYIDALTTNIASPPNVTLSDYEFNQLCNRWTSAGAFYPFSRNHMIIHSRPHEPYRWPDVIAAHKKAYALRYQLLTYMYGSFYLANKQGGTVARALLFTDPTDLQARNATKQWMIGDALLISPVLTPNTTAIAPHFTAGTWYSAWDYSRISVSTGKPVDLIVPLGDVAVHYRGGSIIPVQKAALLTQDVRFSPITLVITLSANVSTGVPTSATTAGPVPPYALEDACSTVYGRAVGALVSCGVLYQDNDPMTVTDTNNLQVWYAAITAANGRSGSVISTVKSNAADVKGKLRLQALHIVGVPQQAAGPAPKLAISGVTAAPASGTTIAYDAAAGVVKVSGLSLDADTPLNIACSL